MIRVPISPEMLQWVRERAGLTQEKLAEKRTLSKLPKWENGDIQPTLKQLEKFARAVHVPIGYLFLSKPPEETLPILGFRTVGSQEVSRPSPNLLDMIYACQERQSWYRDFARTAGEPDLDFVGSASIHTSPEMVAAQMRETLGFDLDTRGKHSTWMNVLRLLIRQADEAGILVMVSGIVMSNPHRRLDLSEFRGFALCDPLAPLVFINGRDSKAAQMFTLAHELAYIWLGASALSNLDASSDGDFRHEEAWCNAVAAEFLVPSETLASHLQGNESVSETLSRLVRIFKVSKLVILRRLLDARELTREEFNDAWARENARKKTSSTGGGNFSRTTVARVGRRFARALVMSTLEERTLYRDAFRMLGIKKTETFNKIGREAGVMS